MRTTVCACIYIVFPEMMFLSQLMLRSVSLLKITGISHLCNVSPPPSPIVLSKNIYARIEHTHM